MVWSETFQRAVIALSVDGGIGNAELQPEWFTDIRSTLVEILNQHLRADGRFPPKSMLGDVIKVLKGQDYLAMRKEVRSVILTPKEEQEFVQKEAKAAIKRRALHVAAIEIEDLSGGEEVGFEQAREIVRKALAAGDSRPPRLSYAADDPLARHRINQDARPCFPTGIIGLDRLLAGGAKGGQLGLILAPTKVGKSHVAVIFGCGALRAGGYVLHITLELVPNETAARYDRSLSGMDSFEIVDDPKRFLACIEEPRSRLEIQGYPRFSATVAQIEDDVKAELDRWGKPGLIILDYGRLLRPIQPARPDIEIGRIHESLSTLCVEENVPLWSPYQTTKAPLSKEANGDVGLFDAGASYESIQHADIIAALCRSEDDAFQHRMEIKLAGSRETEGGVVKVKYDWSRTRLEEIEEDHPKIRHRRPHSVLSGGQASG